MDKQAYKDSAYTSKNTKNCFLKNERDRNYFLVHMLTAFPHALGFVDKLSEFN